MNWSYQHCGSQLLVVPQPGSATFVLVRPMNTGTPVRTLSLRNRREVFVPLFPSYTYMRVLPFGSVLTAIVARDWITAGFSEALICVQVAPPSLERQTPRAYEVA